MAHGSASSVLKIMTLEICTNADRLIVIAAGMAAQLTNAKNISPMVRCGQEILNTVLASTSVHSADTNPRINTRCFRDLPRRGELSHLRGEVLQQVDEQRAGILYGMPPQVEALQFGVYELHGVDALHQVDEIRRTTAM